MSRRIRVTTSSIVLMRRSCGYKSARSGGGVAPTGPVYSETIPPADPYSTLAVDEPHTPLTAEVLESAVQSASAHVRQPRPTESIWWRTRARS